MLIKTSHLKNSFGAAILFFFLSGNFIHAKSADTPVDSIIKTDSTSKNFTRQSGTVVFDTITGLLPDTVKAKKISYLVIGDLTVAAGKTVVIEPGVVFLFKGFTGLHVLGKLIAEGTKDRPIIFTSENDRSNNVFTTLYPNPYDWNGIYFHNDASGSVMKFCTVDYSVYGIVSETKFIGLDPVILRQNGQSNCVIEGKPQNVTDSLFRYVLSTDTVKVQIVPNKIINDPHALKRNVTRITSISAFFIAVGASVYWGMQWKNAQSDLSSMSVDDPVKLRPVNENDWVSLRNKRDTSRLITGAGILTAILAASGFYWSFTF